MATKDIKPRTETGLTRREVLGKALRTGAGAVASSALDTSILGGLADLVTSSSPEVSVKYSVAYMIKELARANSKLEKVLFNPPIGWNYNPGELGEKESTGNLTMLELFPFKDYKPNIPLSKDTNQIELLRHESIAEEIDGIVNTLEKKIIDGTLKGTIKHTEEGPVVQDPIDILNKAREWSDNIFELSTQYYEVLDILEDVLDDKVGTDVTDRILHNKNSPSAYDFALLVDDVQDQMEWYERALENPSMIQDHDEYYEKGKVISLEEDLARPERKEERDEFYKAAFETRPNEIIIDQFPTIIKDAKQKEKQIQLDIKGIETPRHGPLPLEYQKTIEKEMEDFDKFILGAPDHQKQKKDKGEEIVKSLATTAGGEVLKRGLQHLATKKLPPPKPAQPKIAAPRATMEQPPEQGRGLSNLARMLPAVGKRLPFVAPAATLLRSRPAGVDADIVPPDPLGTGRVYRNYHDYNPRNI